MTREEKAIMYFEDMRKKLCDDYLIGIPQNTVAYKATMAEKEFYDTAIEALKEKEKSSYEEGYNDGFKQGFHKAFSWYAGH